MPGIVGPAAPKKRGAKVLKAPTHQGHHAPKLRQAQGVVELWPWPGTCKKNGLERGKHLGKKLRNADLIVNRIGYVYHRIYGICYDFVDIP